MQFFGGRVLELFILINQILSSFIACSLQQPDIRQMSPCCPTECLDPIWMPCPKVCHILNKEGAKGIQSGNRGIFYNSLAIKTLTPTGLIFTVINHRNECIHFGSCNVLTTAWYIPSICRSIPQPAVDQESVYRCWGWMVMFITQAEPPTSLLSKIKQVHIHYIINLTSIKAP